MKNNNVTFSIGRLSWGGAMLAAWALLAPTITAAQEANDAADTKPAVEEIVVVGTRKEGLSPTDTLAPIDVLSGDQFSQQANFDLTDGLSRISPSFNTQRFPIADGTAFLRPVTLRNLSPDHTLVLVNGARRHRSALVNLQLAPLGTTSQGAQAVDFQTIPAIAIKRVEVLRDGASAQYGSDAIAGVVNVVLKDAAEGARLSAQTGQYSAGDGERTTLAGNAGFSLGGSGFFNGSFEYSNSETTSRGNARPDAAFVASVVGAAQTPLNGLGQRWGDPDVEASKLFLNAGYDLSPKTALYSNFSYSEIDVISDFFYRGPVLDPAQMFEARSTLQVDANGDFIPDDAPQSLIDEINAAGLDPNNYLVPDAGAASGFVLRNPIFTMFPGGYNPDFGAEIRDLAWVVGVDGEFGNGWRWDTHLRLAENEVDYVLGETINPSLGRLSPTNFRPGVLSQRETELGIDLVRPVNLDWFATPLNVAFGLELRNETYEIKAGDRASREVGPTAAQFGLGSDGFQGFPEESAGDFDSDSVAGYVDLETDLTEKLSGAVALRFEDYSEFGSTFDGKLSARFDATDKFAVRGTVSTGFRAPTPGQVNTLNVTTTANAQGDLIPSGVYPVNHPVARALGSVPLEPEDSTSFTLGLVFSPFSNTSVTIDYYDIRIKDRLALQNNTISAADVPALQAAGVSDPNLLVGSLANFFSNAFDSDVSGIDLAITSDFALSSGLLTLDLRHNYNQQEVSSVTAGTINASRVFDLENQVPEQRSTATLGYDNGNWFSGHLRGNYYGSWQTTGGLFSPGDASDVSSYGSEILVDLELRFALPNNLIFSLGGENIFDTFPDAEQDGTLQFLGVQHALTSPFGFNGAFYYARLALDF